MSNMFIKSISIENYKTIKKLDNFELKNINILIGANGAGKSNFLSFFNFVSKLVAEKLGAYVAQNSGADSFLTFGGRFSEYLNFEIGFDKNSYKVTLSKTDENTFWFVDEGTEYLGNKNKYNLGGYFESALNKKLNGSSVFYHAKYFAPQFKKIVQYHFHDTGVNSPMKIGDKAYETDKLKYDGKNIAAFIRRLYLNYRSDYELIVKVIRGIVPDFHEFSIKEEVEDDENLVLYWIHKQDLDSIQHPKTLSDGALRFICLVTVLLQPVELMPDIIIIDEPELGLHPKALLMIDNLIERISLQKQFIIATQSTDLVNLFSPHDIVIANKNVDGTMSLSRLDEESLSEWLEDYSVAELWEMNIIGGQP